jgi:hypothetical protein
MPLLLAFNQKTYTCKARKVWGLRKRLTVTTTKKSRNWVIRSWQKSVRLVALVQCFVDDLTSKNSSFPIIISFSHQCQPLKLLLSWKKTQRVLCWKKHNVYNAAELGVHLLCNPAYVSRQERADGQSNSDSITVFAERVRGSFRRFGRFTITAEWWIIVCGWGFMSPIIKR